MLNIGRLAPGAADYYLGEVAKSADDYYLGQGEGAGRWVGSLARELGLVGVVDAEQFRLALNGQHPFTEEYLVSAQGSAARARQRKPQPVPSAQLADHVDTLRAAAHLGVSGQYVRRLLAEGDAYSTRLASAAEGEVVIEPSAYLLGEKDGDWTVTRDELKRFVERRRESKPRPGYDLTLRPPKSVSVLWALSSEDRRATIRQAHREAVDEVVRYYEDAAVFVRDGGGARRLVASAGIVAAAFDHRSSRAGDPLLHTHVVTANMTCTLDDEAQWRTIPGAGLFEHAKAAGHLYQAHLRHLLGNRLGIEFTPVRNGHADVVGVPQQVIELFSKRRHEIAEMLSESGNSSARAAQIATLETRHAKDYGIDSQTLEARWQAEADKAGFTSAEVSACFNHSVPTVLGDPAVAALFEVLGGAHGLTERAATFTRTDVIEAVASAVGAAASARRVEQLADEFLASPRTLLVDRVATPEHDPQPGPQRAVVRRSITQKLYTTPELARLEEKLLEWMAPSATSRLGLTHAVVDEVIAQRLELSIEQADMVRAACETREFCMPIAGRPGAGKTYATEAVVAAHVAAGVPIMGCAVSATAAAELEAAAGFARSTEPATTVARLLVDLNRAAGGLRADTVVVVDEASMIGTRDFARLATAARAAGGSILLIGDYDQHGAVDVGGVFRRLCVDRGDALVRLVENNRQINHSDRLAIDDYRDGRVADALSRYDQGGHVVRSRTAGESFDAIVADWYAARLHNVVDPMIAGPNSTRRALNDRARVLLKVSGELTGEPFVIGGREFMVGDEVVARRNDRSLRGERTGEFVKNGSAGTVASIDHDRGELTVDFVREGRVRVPRSYLAAGRVEHGYARTTYGVQGTTHGVARYHPTDVSSFEEGYVAVTRGREATRIYLVDGNAVEPDENTSHAPADAQPFGMNEIAVALTRRRASHMAADASPRLASVADRLDNGLLRELSVRRTRLERIIATAPPSTTQVIERTRNALDAVRARQWAWRTVLDEPLNVGDESGECRTNRAEASLRSLDSAERRLQRTLNAAERQQEERDVWIAAHADTIADHELTRRAERARETQLRVSAIHHPAHEVRHLLGDEPDSQRGRRAWRRAVEAVAVYSERYDPEFTSGAGLGGVLGARPIDPRAAAEYASVTAAIDDALAANTGRATGVEPEGASF